MGAPRRASDDLLDEQPYPLDLPNKTPLALALSSMRQTLAAILEKHGFRLADVTSARLEFTLPQRLRRRFALARVRSTLVYRGRTYERFLPLMEVR